MSEGSISPRRTVSDILGADFKGMMNEMAVMFPRLPGNIQEQARQAHSHVQELIHGGHYQQAMGLMTHMRDIMRNLTAASPEKGPQIQQPPFITASPPGVNVTGITNVSPAAIHVLEEAEPVTPPLPDSGSNEIVALKRTVEDLQMRMQENSAVTLIAKRVRDMEMEQKYASLDSQLKDMKRAVSDRLERIKTLIDDSESLARVQIRKRTVSRNPFCEHGPSKECDFCAVKEIEYLEYPADSRTFLKDAARPPKTMNAFSDDLTNHEMILNMQNTLKTYQGMLKELLQERKDELSSRGDIRTQNAT